MKVQKDSLGEYTRKNKKKGKGLPYVGFSPYGVININKFNSNLGYSDPSSPDIPTAAGGENVAGMSVSENLDEDRKQRKYYYEGPAEVIDEYKYNVSKKEKIFTYAVSEDEAVKNIKHQIKKKLGLSENAFLLIDKTLIKDLTNQEEIEAHNLENDEDGDYNFYDPDREGRYKVGDDWIGSTTREALQKLNHIDEKEIIIKKGRNRNV